MGAFDGELLKLGYRFPLTRETQQKSGPKTFYVSWDGINGGGTGRHFEKKSEAVNFAKSLQGIKTHIHCWFEI